MIVTNFVQETANGANDYVSVDNENGLISIMLKETYDTLASESAKELTESLTNDSTGNK